MEPTDANPLPPEPMEQPGRTARRRKVRVAALAVALVTCANLAVLSMRAGSRNGASGAGVELGQTTFPPAGSTPTQPPTASSFPAADGSDAGGSGTEGALPGATSDGGRRSDNPQRDQPPDAGSGSPPPPTSPPPTSPPPPSLPNGVIGYLGGSLTRNAVAGYHLVAGDGRLWSGPDGSYGGGTIHEWRREIGQPSAPRWANFNELYTSNSGRGPTTVVWFELLQHGDEPDQMNHDDAVADINEIRARIPGVLIYVSGMNGYTDPATCDGTTAEAPGEMDALAQRLVDEGRALLGPEMGSLTPAQTLDGCHANASGQTVLGNILESFFGS